MTNFIYNIYYTYYILICMNRCVNDTEENLCFCYNLANLKKYFIQSGQLFSHFLVHVQMTSKNIKYFLAFQKMFSMLNDEQKVQKEFPFNSKIQLEAILLNFILNRLQVKSSAHDLIKITVELNVNKNCLNGNVCHTKAE